MLCSIHTCAVTGAVASFTSLSSVPWPPGAPPAPMCECVSISPGVTYLPVPSMTTASAGAFTVAPISTILPSRRRIDPLRIAGPAAVIMVALRMTVGRDGYGTYVLGNGLAFGEDSVVCGPLGRWPVSLAVRVGVGDDDGGGVRPAHAIVPTASAARSSCLTKSL